MTQKAGRGNRSMGLGDVTVFSVRPDDGVDLESVLRANDEQQNPNYGGGVVKLLKLVIQYWSRVSRKTDHLIGFCKGKWNVD